MTTSDPALLKAFRLQCLAAIRPKGKNGFMDRDAASLVFMAWLGQDGVTRDDLIDILKEITADPEPLRNCWPKPEPAPWAGDRPPDEDKLTEYIVIRPGRGLPSGYLPGRYNGRWYRRADIATSEPVSLDDTSVASARAVATGRFERRDDGALAEIYEIQAPRREPQRAGRV